MIEETHYEVLEIGPGASEDEIRKAYKRAQEMYAPGSMVVYTLFTADELAELHERLHMAYETIIDPRTRHAYDLELLAEVPPPADAEEGPAPRAPHNSPARPTPTPQAPSSRPEMPTGLPPGLALTEDTVFTGDALQRIREHRDIDLRDISDHTKISLMNLRYIEDMEYDQLPAAVYVRGFLREYAKYLRLPGRQVVETYLAEYDRALAPAEGEEAP